MSRLNIVHVCDHLGWEGSRMHGVKRLFAWMIPRFDRDAVQRVARQPARARTCREDTLEQFGVDVTYLGAAQVRSADLSGAAERAAGASAPTSCTCTATARRRSAGLCAWRLGIPAILHEHANHTDTPWFQKVADRLLAPHTDLAIAVSESTAEFTMRARLMPAERTKVVYLGVAARRVRAAADGRGDRRGARGARASRPTTIAVGTVTRLMPSKGNQYLVEAVPRARRAGTRARACSSSAKGELQGELEGAGAGARARRSARVRAASSATSRRCSPRSTSSSFRRCGKARR